MPCNVCGMITDVALKNVLPNDEIVNPLVVSQNTEHLPYMKLEDICLHIHNVNECLETNSINICYDCKQSLQQGMIPVYSIQNLFFPERVPPEIKNLSVPETLLIAKVFHRSIVWESQYAHSRLNHHVVCFDAKFNRYGKGLSFFIY